MVDDIVTRDSRLRRTKIVATVGPASSHPETIAAMMRAGMDVVRLNTSHGDIEEHVAACELIRKVAASEGRPSAVLMDLGGPKLRTGPTGNGGAVEIQGGSQVLLTPDEAATTERRIAIAYPRLTVDVRAGDSVLIDDGRIELQVEQVIPGGLECRVVHGGPLRPGRGVGFPGSRLTQPALTDRDREAIAAGVRAGVDLFALSFVRHVEDVMMARDVVNSHGADTPIIAKIERRQAVENLDEILAEADGAMVARGDLGVELPPEEVPVQQRHIIAAAARHMIPVITATQMLESMVSSPRPTRAESSDVANAVWDLSDALMLSEETAIGNYPIESVAMMDRIIRAAEGSMPHDIESFATSESDDHSYMVALAARRIVERDPNMQGIVCFTRSGYTAFLLSKVHADAPIFAVTPSEAVCRRLSLARSVIPMAGPVVSTTEEMLRLVDRLLQEGRHVSEGEEVIVVGSLPVDTAGTTNFLKLHRVGEAARP